MTTAVLRVSRRRAVLLGLSAALGVSSLSVLTATPGIAQGPARPLAAAPTTDWLAYEHGPAHSNAEYGDSAITTANAAGLSVAWSYTAPPSTVSGAPAPRLDASPTVSAGRVFVASRTGILAALDAGTGATLWRDTLDYGSNSECTAKGITGTPAVAADPSTGASTLYAAGSHYLYALNPSTGAQLWKTAIGPATAAGEARYYNWSSPLVVGGKITMGLSAACGADLIRGGAVQLDQHTGKLLHTYYAVPKGTVGTDVWTSQAGDGTSVWVTTGNPDPNASAVNDAFSIVRLSASSFTKQEKWTPSTPISADLDMGASPSFITARINGVSTDLIGACNKNGIFYVWRRNDLAAGPVWQRQVGQVGGMDTGACITSPAFDAAQNAIWVASNQTTVDGVAVQGSIRKLDPATGAILWEQPLGCLPDGSPTVDATTHVLAVPLYGCTGSARPGVALFDSATGTPLRTIQTAGSVFAQPVFAEGKLFVADESGVLTAYRP